MIDYRLEITSPEVLNECICTYTISYLTRVVTLYD